MQPQNLTLFETPAIESYLPNIGLDSISYLLLGLLAAISGICFIFFYLRNRRRSSQTTIPSAWTIAQSALSQYQAPSPQQAALHASLVLRNYLASTVNDSSIYETHEEFLTRSSALSCFNAELKSKIIQHFDALAHLKYAPLPEASSAESILENSRALLTQIHQSSLS